MALLQVRSLAIAFGGPPLLEDVNFTLERGERVCLLGRNGSGKSTLLRLIDGQFAPDAGEIIPERDAVIARLEQEVPRNMSGPVFDVVAQGLGRRGELAAEYHQVAHDVALDNADPVLHKRLDELQHELDISDGWQSHRQVERILSETRLDGDLKFETLSAGLKRRVLLARALVGQPDVLLLDEPTNHLDVQAIQFLEQYLPKFEGALLFITHDRMLLRRLATRILEVDRGTLTDWSCSYEKFLERKASLLETEEKQWAGFDKKLAIEEKWIRTGIKARRTRNEGRVRSLEKMREERSQRREQVGTVRMQAQSAEKTGRLVLEAENVDFAYEPQQPIIRNFSTVITRGDKVGLLGPNGAGKTTLLKILLGELTPDAGELKHGVRLAPIYFDQLHAKLDEDKSVQENVAQGSEHITIDGNKRHVLGYMQDFLFTPAESRTLVKYLSGGERNRLLLAQLFTKPSNVLVMDEPTNDLDVETLELLESLLVDYPGTVLLVSHDREFLNNVTTSVFAFEGDGAIKEYAGGFDEWVRLNAEPEFQPAVSSEPPKQAKETAPKTERPTSGDQPRRLTWNEKQELAALPQKIEILEARVAQLHETMADPDFYQRSGDEIASASTECSQIEEELAAAYELWEELEELQ